jgi:hypothetical protein
VEAVVNAMQNQRDDGKSQWEIKTHIGIESELQSLQQKVNIIGSSLRGTHMERMHMRRELIALVIAKGPPHFFITVNFADLHSPVLLYFAGQKLDLSLDAADLPGGLPGLREELALLQRTL